MKTVVFLLLAGSILTGAAGAVLADTGPLAGWLAVIALLGGCAGLILLQQAVFAPARRLEQALRQKAQGLCPASYGIWAGLAAVSTGHPGPGATIPQTVNTEQPSSDSADRAFAAEEEKERQALLAASLRMARDSMRVQSRHIQAISLEMHCEIDRLAAYARDNDPEAVSASVSILKKDLSECMRGFKSEVDFLEDCLTQLEGFTDTGTASSTAPHQEGGILFAAWSDELATGIEAIDGQHKLLLTYINKLHHAINTGRSREELQEVLEALAGYAFTHFNTEEIFFKRTDYPDTEKHIRIHEDFRTKVEEFHTALLAGKANVDMEVLHFLRDWLIHHISGMDVAFAPYLRTAKADSAA
ncbi:MAG: hemerythrin family protein [Desulfovibrio sp.]|nr:hemerythrin family protein [Desulfovibrio sp.]